MSASTESILARAALGLIESMLAQLVEKGVLSNEDVDEIYDGAEDAFETASEQGSDNANHAIAELLERLHHDKDSVITRL